MGTNTFSLAALDRPSAFRLPASRTAGGKLHALEEGARGNNDYNSLSHGYAVPAPSKRELQTVDKKLFSPRRGENSPFRK